MKILVDVWLDSHGDIQVATGRRGEGFRARISNKPRSIAYHPYLYRALARLLESEQRSA